jgi:hypothetical protein
MTTKQVRQIETKAFVVCQAVVLQNGIASPAFLQLSRADGSLLAPDFGNRSANRWRDRRGHRHKMRWVLLGRLE